MPWRQTSPMDQRTQSIADALRQTRSIVELCELYGVSRTTDDKWIERYLQHGPLGLEERSRKLHPSPNHTPGMRSRPSSSCAVITLRGVQRNGCRSSGNVSRAGRYPHAPPSAIS
jgi:transposase-like protein